jgi:hypothetical protein
MIQRVHSSNMISLYIYTACSYQNEIKYNKAIPRFAHLLSLRCFGRLFLRAIHLWLVRHRNKVLLISYMNNINTGYRRLVSKSVNSNTYLYIFTRRTRSARLPTLRIASSTRTASSVSHLSIR